MLRTTDHHDDGVEVRTTLLHFLAEASVAGLVRTLSRHGGVSPRHYTQLMIMAASVLLRWPGCMIEAVRVARRLKSVSFDPPPLFIVGHGAAAPHFCIT
jgi:hypothetical protein